MTVLCVRKKPVVVAAMLYNGTNHEEVCDWVNENNDHLIPAHQMADRKSLIIPTLEEPMVADVGDYIIRGVKGEFYPCKPDIFALTYEVLS